MAEISITLLGAHSGNEHIVKFPARFAVCWDCEGCGTDRGRSVERDGGGFTASEWDEEDECFRRAYIAGRYDLPCETCKGQRVVLEIDHDAITAYGAARTKYFKKMLARHEADQREEADYQAICAAERRMGA